MHPTTPRIQRIFAAPLLAFSVFTAGALGAAETEKPAKPDIDVTVTATVTDPVESVGKTVIGREEVQRQVPGGGDLNQIARTLNNVQFDAGAGQLNESSILNLRPALLSISGGRAYENNFTIEGLSTTSVTDTTNTNIHQYDNVVGHPQTTFLNPALVDSVTVFASDVPAEYGGFTGGVVSAKLRDPSGRFGGGLAADYSGSDLVHYLSDPADRLDPLPEKPSFHRESYDAYLDLPTVGKVASLFGWSRKDSVLQNTQKLSSYGLLSRRATTQADTFVSKFLYTLSPESKLRFTSVWSPYRQENNEQDLKIQNNDGWLNKLEYTRTTASSELTAYAGFQWAANDREQAPNLYTYKNFGAGDKVDWVADTVASGGLGGNGDMNSRQQDIPLGAKYDFKLTETGTLSAGADYTYTKARKQRPETNNAYRHQTSSTVVKDPTVVSAYGASDLTVLEGEQALNYKITYLAFDANVELQSGDAWVQWSDKGKLFGLPWSYRTGLRAETDDFLKNNTLAPRATGQISPFSWLSVHAGYSRYYTHEMLAYKLREKYPDNYIYTRTYRLENGKKVFYDDWTLNSYSKTASYAQAGLATPYSDELSFGTTFDFKRYGTLYVHYLDRKSRDEFARDAGTKTSYVNIKTGATSTYTLYRVSNDGFTDYHSTSFEWNKRLANHRFLLGATFSKTKTSTVDDTSDYFDGNNTTFDLDEDVYYNGAIVTRRAVALTRANFARPDYYNFVWSSEWFKRRLTLDVIGRWNTAYDYVKDANTTIKVNGLTYDRYDDTHVPANLINDLSVNWTAWETRRGTLSVSLKVGNAFDRLPHSENTSTSDPYQQGRSFWLRTSYTF